MITSENRKTIKCFMSIGSTLTLALVVLYSYFPAFDNSFVSWDDQYYITLNPYITNPTWDSFKQLWSAIISLNYHPITMSSLWLNSYLSGIDSASPYIVTNVCIHFCNALLVYYTFAQLFPRSLVLSIFVTLVFAIHPMHVESVVWTSERKDVLYAFFFLSALISYLQFIKTSKKIFYALAISLFLFSCLSKAMAVSLVPVLFVIDYMKFKTNNFHLFFNKIPFLVIGLLIGSIAVNIQSGGDALGFLDIVANEKAIVDNVSVPLWDRLSYGSYSLLFYVVKFFWPFELAAFHPYDIIVQVNFFQYCPLVFIVLFVFLVKSVGYSKEVFFGLLFFIFTIVLVLQFLPVGSALVAERYSYLPYIGLASVVGYGLQSIYDLYSKSLVVVLLFLITLLMSCLTRKQSDVWQDQVSLFGQVVKLYPENSSSRHYLATGYWQQGKYGQAISHLKYAIDSLNGVTDQNFELLANSYSELGDTVEAVTYYKKAIELNPDNVVAIYHRALLLVDVDPSTVVQDLTHCERSNNVYVNQFIYTPRGRAYGQLGNYELAILDFKKAIELFPEDIWNYYDLGLTHELNNEFKEAVDVYKGGLKIDPSFQLIKERVGIISKTLQ